MVDSKENYRFDLGVEGLNFMKVMLQVKLIFILYKMVNLLSIHLSHL